MKKKRTIGLLGLGTVGGGVVKVLKKFDNIEIKRIAVRNPEKAQIIEGLDRSIITTDSMSIAKDKDIDVLIEVIGGINPAFDLIKEAIKSGKHVVTANKELIAKHGEEIFDLAKEHNVVVLYEAAVAGGIPIIMPLKQSLAANRIKKVEGILNGTTNYILTKMERENLDFNVVLEEAQALGYAEADPTGDVMGHDAGYKIAILASLAFNKRIDVNKVYRQGITDISSVDIEYAEKFGYKIKLIARAEEFEDGQVDVRVHPMLVSKNNLISGIDDVMNAVAVTGDAVGKVMFSGPGAGELPTASSVVGDLLAIASEMTVTDYPLPVMRCKHEEAAQQIDITETQNKYYIRLKTQNVPGVIGELGITFGKYNINLNSFVQKGILDDGDARIVLLTEIAYEKDINAAIANLSETQIVTKVENVIRVMD
ncbi:MAG: homoserine dehydrogenase [bacterium]